MRQPINAGARGIARGMLFVAACSGLLAPSASHAQSAPVASGWSRIFDGRSLAGWTGSEAFTVDSGVLIGHGHRYAQPRCTEQTYGDFVLRFRARARYRAS